jgi:hypothetical protein
VTSGCGNAGISPRISPAEHAVVWKLTYAWPPVLSWVTKAAKVAGAVGLPIPAFVYMAAVNTAWTGLGTVDAVEGNGRTIGPASVVVPK